MIKAPLFFHYYLPADLAETKEKIIAMSLNGRGMRDITRVLKISSNTVTREFKKRSALRQSTLTY
ncbi:IS1-like element transposase [Piscirickettsia salmonis]|uniref:IS1-like element transposase n=1 Tax=Piscirickettsia salmonis TaxID=1238 RepID=UPI00064C741C|nr:hypothetical protein AWJ11_03005 [Piscirickettsia salmonis]APS61364.1 hypothetical protein AVI53_12950 [Piscirickettsia salmonis]KLV36210.1 hypothetical protein AB894_04260 [Piscirickettsia salmonis]QHS25104.1 hypothetical protein GW538_03075 [Piscirickettsia salmonis]QHS28309.1 hypothetical protein GW537_03065 [Piscirickettsia salmonis]